MNKILMSALWLTCSLAVAEDLNLNIPSYVSFQMGGSDQKSRNGSLQAAMTITDNWQLGMGLDGGSTPSEVSDDTLHTRSFFLSLGSNPLDRFSFVATGESWRVDNNVEARGGRLEGFLLTEDWQFGLEGGYSSIRLRELPQLIWPSGEDTVHATAMGGSVEYFKLQPFEIRIRAVVYRYDKDLADYAEGVRVLFIDPSVLTTVSGLNESEGSVTLTYVQSRWTGGVEVGGSKSALDGVRTRKLGLLGTYSINESWGANASLSFYKPENADVTTKPATASTLGVVFRW